MSGAGSAAGAALGSAVMPGVGTAVGGFLGSLLDGKSNSGGGGGGYAPLNSQSAVYGSGLDGSGWAVNFGGTQTASSSPANAIGIPPTSQPPLIAGMSTGTLPPWLWVAAAGLGVWKIARSNR